MSGSGSPGAQKEIYCCHYTVATQLTAEGSADDLHGSPLYSACMNAHVTCRSTDIVCMLYGRKPLFILRPTLEDTKFHLVGDACVHGLMDLRTTRTTLKCEDETFNVV